MNSIWNFVNNLYKEVNGATLTGAIDVIVIQQEDGSYLSSPFHVRFGKIGVLRSREKVVDIEINGEPINIHMKLGESGEAFFVEETDDSFEFPSYLATSPISSYTDMGAEIKKLKQRITSDGVDPDTDSSSDLPTIVRAGELLPDAGGAHQYFPDHLSPPPNAPSLNSGSTPTTTEGFVVSNDGEDDAASLTDLLAASNVSPDHLEDVKVGLDDMVRGGANLDGELLTKIARGDAVTLGEIAAAVGACSQPTLSTNNESAQFKPIQLPVDEAFASSAARSAAFATELENSAVVPANEQESVPASMTDAVDVASNDPDADKGKSKKKRKRKSTVRRKLQPSRSSQVLSTPSGSTDAYREGGGVNGASSSSNNINKDNSASSEEPSEEIFQMDADLDEFNAVNGVVVTGASSARELHVSRSQADLMTASGTSDYQECNITSTDEWQYKTMQLPRSFHPFSDGETSTAVSPTNSRPSTPKSDSEYEMHKMDSMLEGDEHRWSWTWGELPVPPKVPSEPQREEPASDDDTSEKAKQIKKDQEEQRSTFQLTNMPKKERQASAESEGRYLEDLLNVTDMDPEVAQLYFSRNSAWTGHRQNKDSHAKDDDSESGNGSSLPQSPHSVEGAIGGAPSSGLDSDMDDRSVEPRSKELHGVAFSLCGNLESLGSSVPEDKFEQSIVTYDNFCNTPSMINNPNLVIRISGKYYNWQTAAPILMSVMVFQRQLPETVVTNLVKDHMPEKPKKAEGTRYSWFKWGRSPAPEADSKKSDGSLSQSTSPLKPNSLLEVNQDGTQSSHKNSDSSSGTFNENSKPEPLNQSSDLDSSQAFADSDVPTLASPSTEKYKKSLRLTSEKIAKLNLHEGPNEVVFSVTTAYQGTTRCKCHIYLWKYDDQIIISDIDGTITKSDVLGHILPIVGTSWAQSGVAQLFTNIKRNGYQFLYLSARAIGQARVTRDYLRSIRQGDLSLPDGPLLLSPSSLLSALRREVIEKKPEEFKISCLRDIQALFVDKNPFYAGYGNKVNDVWAYRAVGIPMSRIFTINHRGELKYELNRTFQSSYAGMSYVVDHVFPPLVRTVHNNGLLSADFVAAEEFSSFTYWRDPLPDIAIELEDVLRPDKGEEKK